ncbi:N-acetylneuraminate synthase family protein [Candidatus Pelagibacter sp.]|jgi:N,N'-diacetyllegionaminate synthase|nr:N-acetylneuraminate synthase family protein [Candidatus Pelagibacter sp.]
MLQTKNQRVIIIAEAGVNHNGKIKLAKKLIDIAKNCGADFIKFQNWQAKDLVTNYAKMAPYQIKNTKKNFNQIELLKPLELKKKYYPVLKKYSKIKKIGFLSSPFDEKNYRYLTKELGCKLVKIPSGEINNFFMLNEVDLKKEKLIMSTGMSNLKEIAQAINFIAKSKVYKVHNNKVKLLNIKKYNYIKDKISLLHCVTDYPVQEKFANLKCIKTLINNFKLNVGYSDHTSGILAPIIAVSLGAKIVEKHLTINKKMSGPDHKASIEENEFLEMTKNIRSYEKMIGTGFKDIQKCEIKNMKIARKSIVARTKILKGEIFNFSNLTAKRPASGKRPSDLFEYLGKRSKKIYKKDDLII